MIIYDIKNLSFSYGDQPVVNDVSFQIEEGKFYGVIGPNGSGKTTVLDLLMNHIRPDTGSITFKGKALNRYSRRSLSREISLVTQNFYINFPYTVEEIVLMGRYPYIGRFSRPTPRDVDIVRGVMVKTGIYRFKNRYINELSGGERQRVVVARAFSQDTPVIILDEATSNLDINHAIHLLGHVHQCVRKEHKTVISVFQDINLALLFCDQLIVLNNGRIKARGDSDSVMTESLIADVFGVSSKVYFDDFANTRHVVFKGGCRT